MTTEQSGSSDKENTVCKAFRLTIRDANKNTTTEDPIFETSPSTPESMKKQGWEGVGKNCYRKAWGGNVAYLTRVSISQRARGGIHGKAST